MIITMDVKKIKSLASKGALGQLDVGKAQVGSNEYGFVFFDFNDTSVDPMFRKWSGKVCGAGAHFGDFEKFMALDEIKFDKLSDVGGLMKDIKHDLLLAGSLKTLLPDMEFGGDEMLFDVLLFVVTPDDQFFPATFYYGPSGTSLGGWDSEDYKRFPRKMRDEFNFSPFDLVKDGLTGLIEAQIFALQKVPVSDFCGIYSYDLGNSLMCVYDGVAFIVDLGYDYDEVEIKVIEESRNFYEFDIKIVLRSIGYDFERDKFNFKELVKKASDLDYISRVRRV